MSCRKSGFSFMELMVVIVIMSILSTTVIVTLVRWPGRARIAKAKTVIGQLELALADYFADQQRYPTEEQGLQVLVEAPSTPPIAKDYPEAGYLKGLTVPKDSWGFDYVYIAPGPSGKPYEIKTYGRDNEPGGEGEDADISNLSLNE